MKKSHLSFPILLLSLTSCSPNNPDSKHPHIPKSASASGILLADHGISRDSANKMLESYILSVGETDTALKSLIIDADALRGYLSNSDVKHIKIMFAHTLDYINAGNNGRNAYYHPGRFTIVLSGYNENNDYIYWGPERMAINQALFCPTLCPTYGTAANDLLQ